MEITHHDGARVQPFLSKTSASKPVTRTLLFHSTPCASDRRIEHNLRSCLSALAASAELLETDIGERQQARLERMKRTIAHMQRLLERDRVGLVDATETEEVDTEVLLEDICARLRDRADVRGVTLVVRPGVRRLRLERGAFAEALFNLVDNAIEATTDGVVSVEVQRGDGGDVLFQVRDQGHGMSRDTLAQIGTPRDSARDRTTGLGIALTNAVVERHGGLLHFESQLGFGTTASIWLPDSTTSTSFDLAV